MELDKLLARLLRRKEELLKVLECPEIPLHTNASENDLRSCVTKHGVIAVRSSRAIFIRVMAGGGGCPR